MAGVFGTDGAFEVVSVLPGQVNRPTGAAVRRFATVPVAHIEMATVVDRSSNLLIEVVDTGYRAAADAEVVGEFGDTGAAEVEPAADAEVVGERFAAREALNKVFC